MRGIIYLHIPKWKRGELSMNRVFLNLGPITIYWYSIIILTAILLGMFLAFREAKKVGLKDYLEELAFYLIIYGIIGARLYYVIFAFDNYKNDLLSIFKIWEGGLAIYGAIIAGIIVIVYNSIKHKKSMLATTDVIVPSLILGQAIGRWGNFFNGEAHGGAVSRAFLEQLHLPRFIINGMYINGNYYHPTFLYESLWCLVGFVLLLIIRKVTNRKKGIVTYSYFIWYGIGRLLIEGLRTDSLYIGSIRVSQLVSIVLIIVGLIGIIKSTIKKEKINKTNKKKEVRK